MGPLSKILSFFFPSLFKEYTVPIRINGKIEDVPDGDLQKMINTVGWRVTMGDDGQINATYNEQEAVDYKAFHALPSDEKTAIGHANNYGFCKRCGHTWNWKKGRTVKYTNKGRGTFPLCVECFNDCIPQERYDYVIASLTGYNPELVDVDIDLIRKEVDLS